MSTPPSESTSRSPTFVRTKIRKGISSETFKTDLSRPTKAASTDSSTNSNISKVSTILDSFVKKRTNLLHEEEEENSVGYLQVHVLDGKYLKKGSRKQHSQKLGLSVEGTESFTDSVNSPALVSPTQIPFLFSCTEYDQNILISLYKDLSRSMNGSKLKKIASEELVLNVAELITPSTSSSAKQNATKRTISPTSKKTSNEMISSEHSEREYLPITRNKSPPKNTQTFLSESKNDGDMIRPKSPARTRSTSFLSPGSTSPFRNSHSSSSINSSSPRSRSISPPNRISKFQEIQEHHDQPPSPPPAPTQISSPSTKLHHCQIRHNQHTHGGNEESLHRTRVGCTKKLILFGFKGKSETVKSLEPYAELAIHLSFIKHRSKYLPLEKILLDPKIELVKALSLLSLNAELTEQIQNIVTIFHSNNKISLLSKFIVEAEMDAVKSANLILREDNFSTQLFRFSIKLNGKFFIDSVIRPLVESYMNIGTPEVDPTRLDPKKGSLESNQSQILSEANFLISTIIKNSLKLSPFIMCLGKEFYHASSKKFESEETGKVTLGAVLFLRYICPSLLDFAYDTEQRRHVLLLSKMIQQLANRQPFGEKEEYMKPLNKFIETNLSLLDDFYVALSQMDITPKPYMSKIPTSAYQDLGRFLFLHKDEILAHLPQESLILRQTISVINDLCSTISNTPTSSPNSSQPTTLSTAAMTSSDDHFLNNHSTNSDEQLTRSFDPLSSLIRSQTVRVNFVDKPTIFGRERKDSMT